MSELTLTIIRNAILSEIEVNTIFYDGYCRHIETITPGSHEYELTLQDMVKTKNIIYALRKDLVSL